MHKHLKTCLKGGLDLAKSVYHSGKIWETLTVLVNAYLEPYFIRSEIYKNLKSMPSASSFQNVKATKYQLQT